MWGTAVDYQNRTFEQLRERTACEARAKDAAEAAALVDLAQAGLAAMRSGNGGNLLARFVFADSDFANAVVLWLLARPRR